MPMSNFPGGFAHGVSIRGVPLLAAYPGEIFWVHSGSGSNGNPGTHTRPFATIDYAVGRCTANRGDIIMVKPGHTETVTAAAGLDLDVAGIAVVGMGVGSNRPTINFTTATTADMDVDAANITLYNLLFTGGVDALAAPIDVNAADFAMYNCEMRDVTGQMVLGVLTDANAARMVIDGFTYRGDSAAGANSAIRVVGGSYITLRNLWIDGNFAVSAVENVTTATTNFTLGGFDQTSYIRTRNAADVCVTMVATSTGWIGPNLALMLKDDAANITEAVVGAAMTIIQPVEIVNADGESSMKTNITASTDA